MGVFCSDPERRQELPMGALAEPLMHSGVVGSHAPVDLEVKAILFVWTIEFVTGEYIRLYIYISRQRKID